MATTVNGNMTLRLNLTHENPESGSTASESFPQITYNVASGTTASSMDKLWTDTRTLAASATEDLDLAGALVNKLGDTTVFADVRLICVVASSANTNNVLVGGAASNQFINWVGNVTDIVVVKPGGILFLYTPTDPGYAVTAGTGDLLKIANSGGTTGVTYNIYVGGASA
jgi:hypothetical protein